MPIGLPRFRSAARAAREPTLPGYVGRGGIYRWRWPLIGMFAFLLLIYGFFWAVGGVFLLRPLLALPALMLLAIIWLLPDSERPPLQLTWRLLVAFIIGLLCWPNYIALALPGLPWITVVRLIGLPLALSLLISLSVSPRLRNELATTLSATPLVWRLMATFAVLATISVVFSAEVAASLNKLTEAMLTWFMIFLAAVLLFRKPERLQVLLVVIVFSVICVCIMAIWEARIQKLPWIDHIPSFLQIDGPEMERLTRPKMRSTVGEYRVQSKFSTPLGLAEFVALASPLVAHTLLTHKTWLIRICALLALPLSAYTIYLADSRLGIIGILASGLLFLFVIGLERWRERRDSLIAPLIMLSYPIFGAFFVAATFVVGRLRGLVWGSGAEQYSNDARVTQYLDGLDRVMARPWGYGIGQGAAALDFRTPAGDLTIDTYYVVIALEYGVLGFLAYFGIFVAAISYGIGTWLKSRGPTSSLIAPLTIAMVVFLVLKLVFSQQENNPLIFALLGALVALIRYAKDTAIPRSNAP